MNVTRRKFCTILSTLPMFGTVARAQSRHVVLGHVDLSFYEVTASVIQIVLERLGHNVGVQKGSHAEIYPLLGKGEVELFVAAWLPNAHAPYWEQYQDSLEKVAMLFDDARLFWSVPDYVPASEVSSVADLRKPGVAARMQKEIRGTRPDSGLMIGSKKIMEEYRLEEPKQLPGGPDKVYLVVHRDFRGKVDKHTWNALQRISLSIKSVTELDYLVNVKKLAPQYAARNWMAAHPDTVNYWLQPDPEE